MFGHRVMDAYCNLRRRETSVKCLIFPLGVRIRWVPRQLNHMKKLVMMFIPQMRSVVKEIKTNIGTLKYDYLVPAMGANTNFWSEED
jgi:hypothetical protein